MGLIDDNWEYRINFMDINNDLKSFKDRLYNIEVPKKIEAGFEDVEECFTDADDEHYPQELEKITEEKNTELNNTLQKQLEAKLTEISNCQSRYETFKQERQLLSKEIIETHNAFLRVKKYYKRLLKIYYTIETVTDTHQIIYLQFFTEAKKENEIYSVRFEKDRDGNYELIEMKPKPEAFKDIQSLLRETRDIPSTLYLIREQFLQVKGKK